jgi:hypothetical protein
MLKTDVPEIFLFYFHIHQYMFMTQRFIFSSIKYERLKEHMHAKVFSEIKIEHMYFFAINFTSFNYLISLEVQ